MTTTTNYGWTKPTVGGDSGTWGAEINTALDSIDTTVKAVSVVANAALPQTGGGLTGPLSVGGDLTVTGKAVFESDANFNLRTTPGFYVLQMSALGGINYDAAQNRLNVVANGITVGYFDATGYHTLV